MVGEDALTTPLIPDLDEHHPVTSCDASETERFAPGVVLLVVPAFNEEAAIRSTLCACLSIAAAEDILVVDDGSSDGTAAAVAALGVPCVRLPVNLGIGGAVQTGYRYAARTKHLAVVQLDGDGQHDPRDLVRLVRPVLDGACDMAVGSRYLNNDGYRSTLLRRLGSWLLSTALRISTGRRILDCTSGFRAINRALVDVFVDYYPSDYPEPESLAVLLHAGFRVVEVPVSMRQRAGGRSSIRPVDSVIYMAKLVSVIGAHWIAALPVTGGKRGR